MAAVAATAVTGPAWEPAIDRAPAPVTVAMAGGKAFTFGYAEHVELLTAAGAEVVVFDPLTDPLPDKPTRSSCPADFPRSSPQSCLPTTLRANRFTRWPPAAHRCTRNARA